MTDPIRKTVTVPLHPDAAFDLFTDKLGDWWPVETHSISGANGKRPKKVKVDKKKGGHITETKADGEPTRWATVTRWEPGRAFGLSWYVGRDEDEATDIMVVFTPVDTGTRVDLVHDGFDRLAETAMMQRENYDHGWSVVLSERYRVFCQSWAKSAAVT